MTVKDLVIDASFVMFWSFLAVGAFVPFYLYKKKYRYSFFLILLIYWNFLWRLVIPLIYHYLFGEKYFFYISELSSFFTSLSLLLIFPLLVIVVNFLLQGKILQSASTLLLLPILWVTSLETKFFFYPLLDTTHSPEFTLKKFKSIKSGMTRQEMGALIGKPHPKAGGYFASDQCESQTGDNAASKFLIDFAWLDSAVCYDENDRVIETKMGYVPD